MAEGENSKALAEAKKTARSKSEAAVSLKVAGASFEEIAEMLDFESPQIARRAVERALSSQASIEDKDALRRVQNQRLEKLLKSVMPRATNPRDTQQLNYNARANALIDRIIKLQGLDAPTQVQVTPSDEYLASYTQSLKKELGLEDDIIEEADILDEEEA